MEHFDVVVAGAGPAGGHAARCLAEQGFRVLLLEKAPIPRYKACGGGLTDRAVTEMGIPVDGVVERCIHRNRCRLEPGLEEEIFRPERPVLRMVMRDRLDAALSEAAARAGAELRSGTTVRRIEETERKVIVRTDRGVVTAAYLVGADGIASVTARSTGLRVKTRWLPALEAELRPPSGRIAPFFEDRALYHFGAVRGGYGWVFPKGEHYSVGVCSTFPRSRGLIAAFQRFRADVPALASCTTLRLQGWLIPLGAVGGRPASGRVLLCGDAAGCADPFTGEGISFALKSARLAARVLAEALSSGGAPGLAAYRKALDRELYREFRIARFFAKIFYTFPRLTFRVFLRDPRVVRHFFELTAGRENYSDMIRLCLRHGWRLRVR